MMTHDITTLEVGQVLATQTFPLTRDSLVRYAGASGDFNPIHYRDDVAESVGLPGVLAHGMLTMGVAVSPLLEWCGTEYELVSYQVRFTKPVVVDPETGASLEVQVSVGALIESEDGTPQVRCDLTVTSDAGEKVLGKAQAVIRAA
ncbi:MaoC/PaaZ C-terminal domain-containing protein [Pontimonas salivibrio]